MNRLIQPCFPSKRVGKYISAAYSSERCFNFIYFKPHFNNRQQLQSNISKQNQSGRQFGAVKNAIEKEMSEKIKTAQDQYQQCESSLLSAADAVACHSSSEDSSLLKHTSKKVVFSSSRSESMVLAGEVKAGRGGSVRLWMKWVRVMSLRLRQCCLPPTFTLTKHFLPILKLLYSKPRGNDLYSPPAGFQCLLLALPLLKRLKIYFSPFNLFLMVQFLGQAPILFHNEAYPKSAQMGL